MSLTVEVVACACPELVSEGYIICNSENSLDLSLFVPDGLEGGIWSLDLSGSVGSAPLIEFGALIFDSTVSGDFSLFYDYSDLGFLGCPAVDTLYLEINSLELVSLNEERVDIEPEHRESFEKETDSSTEGTPSEVTVDIEPEHRGNAEKENDSSI